MSNLFFISCLLISPNLLFSQLTAPFYGDINKTSSSILFELPQDTNYKYLKKINNQIVFEKIYVFDSLRSEEIENDFISIIPDIVNISPFKKSTKITSFSLRNVYVDYKKYGLHKMTMSPLLAFPMNCNMSVVWKDGKYKITASEITFDVVSFGIQRFTDHILNDKLWFDDKKIVTTLGHCVESFFADKFKIENNK